MAMIPETLANMNLFVDGISFQGVVLKKNQKSVRPEITVGQCIDDVILFLEELETLYQEKTL